MLPGWTVGALTAVVLLCQLSGIKAQCCQIENYCFVEPEPAYCDGVGLTYYPTASCINNVCQQQVCFPEAATIRRVAGNHKWENIAMPQLRVGDTVECLVRQPVFHPTGRVTSASYGALSLCNVYGYKKAMANVKNIHVTITYNDDDARPAAVAMTPNHHVLCAETGQAVQAGAVRVGDSLLMASNGTLRAVKVLQTTQVPLSGAYVPLLTQGGLPVVDGIVAYPSSGDSDAGLDAKHWGQYYLSAPVWQNWGSSNIVGKTLFELGSQNGKGIGAFTQKMYVAGAAAAASGDNNPSCDWAWIAKEMHGQINKGHMYTEEEALALYKQCLEHVFSNMSSK